MTRSPVRFRTVTQDGKMHLAATIGIYFGPSVYDCCSFQFGRLLGDGESVDSPAIQGELRRALAQIIAEAITADEWGTSPPSLNELLAMRADAGRSP